MENRILFALQFAMTKYIIIQQEVLVWDSLSLQSNMPHTKPCDGYCVKIVQFIGTHHYQVTRLIPILKQIVKGLMLSNLK